MTDTATAAGCSVKPVVPSRQQTISVNGVVIARAAIARETQNHPADKPIEAWHAAARALVVRELLLQEARRLGVPPTPLDDEDGRRETDDEAMVRALVEARGADARGRRGRLPSLFRAQPRPLPLAGYLRGAPYPVAGLAERSGRARPRPSGGHEIIERQTRAGIASPTWRRPSPPVRPERPAAISARSAPARPFPNSRRALGSLPVGEVAPEPVETRYGFHVVMLERRIAGRQLPFELVHAASPPGWRIGRAGSRSASTSPSSPVAPRSSASTWRQRNAARPVGG